MSPFTKRFRRPAILVLLPLLVAACGGSTKLNVETRNAPTPISVSPVAGGSRASTGGSSSSSSLAAPVPTAITSNVAPPASTPASSSEGSIEFKPTSLVQGGTAVVYLNESASSATLRFNDKQYPMLHDGKRWWAIVGVNAVTPAGVVAASITYTPTGKQNSITVAASISVMKRDFPTENIDLDDSLAGLADKSLQDAETAQRQGIYSGFTAQRLWSGPFLPPIQSEITDIYGVSRSYNGGPIVDFHRGTSFAGNTGDPVTASANGKVAFAGTLKIRGDTVIIDHGAGVFTAYLHLSRMDVKEGQLVKAGDQIGEVGATGLVTGPHLQWEVIVRGVEVDGRLWLQGTEIGP
jgi:murein DD-endopeptidase MepM/ murein hydrolase activator NlpD